jgi:hypothetical protein
MSSALPIHLENLPGVNRVIHIPKREHIPGVVFNAGVPGHGHHPVYIIVLVFYPI